MVQSVTEAPGSNEEIVDELRSWLEDNWDPDLSLGEWWERLGLAGWSAPTLPEDGYGRGVSRSAGNEIAREISRFGALGAPGGLGLMLAAPTIADHGTKEQIDTYVRDIVTGKKAWCQLFSEPGAGSDLAGLTTRAVQDGDEWVVTGQKVWTSLGQTADLGMLLARTDPDLPKHQGITYFAFDMRQPGVEVRPLREMTGHAMFNEVFITDARAHTSGIIGGRGNGWAVANTTLGHERAGLGAGGGNAGAAVVTAGQVAGNLSRRVGDFVAAPGSSSPKTAPRKRRGPRTEGLLEILIGMARGNGKSSDAVVRQDLARLYTLDELGRYNTERMKAARATGRDIPGMANISKLLMSTIVRLQRDVGLGIAGAQGMLHAYDPRDQDALDQATGNPVLGALTTTALYAQAPSIYGGTDQIQRNIVGERVLGLPKEPSNDKTVPFSELPKNG